MVGHDIVLLPADVASCGSTLLLLLLLIMILILFMKMELCPDIGGPLRHGSIHLAAVYSTRKKTARAGGISGLLEGAD